MRLHSQALVTAGTIFVCSSHSAAGVSSVAALLGHEVRTSGSRGTYERESEQQLLSGQRGSGIMSSQVQW